MSAAARSAGLAVLGCHDIPGFEDAKPIGTGLADWGRKEPSKLAFEQVVQYLAQENFVHGHGHIHNIEEALDPHHMDPDTGFFIEAVLHHEREGFIWQKLREPRSYDYRMTENKDYTERLRMPKFNLTDKQREAVITFVLGLVAEPPAAQYVYKADPRRQAVIRRAAAADQVQLRRLPYVPHGDVGRSTTIRRISPNRRRSTITRSRCRTSRRRSWRNRRRSIVAVSAMRR